MARMGLRSLGDIGFRVQGFRFEGCRVEGFVVLGVFLAVCEPRCKKRVSV